MVRFIAIPVGQGDAFYLERTPYSILIDGGRSKYGFYSQFKNVTGTDGVNFAVCTHNDADHANGVLCFLKESLRCDEVWLPGHWLTVLPDVLKPFPEVFDDLAGNVAKLGEQSNNIQPNFDLSPLEVYAENLPEEEMAETNEGPPICEDGWPESYINILEQAEPWEAFHWGLWRPTDDWWGVFPDFFHLRQKLGSAGMQLLWSAIEAANRIRAIAIKAFHRGIPVRWFEYNPDNPSGGEPVLKPVNSREIAKVRPRIGLLLYYLALSVANRESLVFWSPPTDQHPGVLFTADSDLTNVKLPSQLHNALVTAPHHGSEANANAYALVTAAANNVSNSLTWIRSDGRYKTRPGGSYLGLSSQRLCTLCRVPAGSKTITNQPVYLYSRKGSWKWCRAGRHKTRICSCQ